MSRRVDCALSAFGVAVGLCGLVQGNAAAVVLACFFLLLIWVGFDTKPVRHRDASPELARESERIAWEHERIRRVG